MLATVPRPWGGPALTARSRSTPEDFVVVERLGFEPDGEGEHVFATVRKRGANTTHVAAQLARWAGIAEAAVGYAGMKDRHAVATQTFSLHLPGREPPLLLPVDGEFSVLELRRHRRKLPRGALQGNRFELVLREVQGEPAAIEARLAAIAGQGVPNAFGGQRFGRGGGNLDAARRMFAGRRVRRSERAILLSAARAALFNTVLAARIADGSWQHGLDGEIWMLAGSRSVFGPVALDDTLRQRAAEHDIDPTGPLWGAGACATAGAAAAVERAALTGQEDLMRGLEAAGLRQERRALRVVPGDLAFAWEGDGVLRLAFELPAGAYATAVLQALGDVSDAMAD